MDSYLNSILEKYHLQLSKSFGQNFLIDSKVKEYIKSLFNEDDIVLEIGPGIGSVTNEILPVVKDLTAVEIDKRFIPILEEIYSNQSKFHIINEDILKYEIPFKAFEYKIYGSLPYNISKKIIRKVIEAENPPLKAYFIVQKEVGEDYLDKHPFTSLSLVSKSFADFKKLLDISPASFFPSPKVKSVLIEVTPKRVSLADRQKFLELNKFIKGSFITPRKQLVNVLPHLMGISKNNIFEIFEQNSLPLTSRAEELDIEDWSKIYTSLKLQNTN